MRVALIGPVPPTLGGATPGGVATHQVHLAAGLAAAGVCAPLLATNTHVPARAWRAGDREGRFPLYRMAYPESARGDYLAAVGPWRAARYAAYLAGRPSQNSASRRETLGNLLWYRHFLAEARPNVIHVQHPLERCSYVRLVERLEGQHRPLVVTAHSLFGEHAEATIEGLMGPNLRAADRVIAVSDHIAEQTVTLGVRPEQVRVIRSGVDVQQFSVGDRSAARRALGLAESTPLVLFVGNLEPRKQVDVLLQALARMRQQVPDVRLAIVGSGQSAGALDQTARLVQLSRELQLTDVAQFVGRVDDRRLHEYYAAADVFALPSRSEAQGIVALEAMACGLPVVASAVGGLLGTIEDAVSGFLVPSGEVGPLAARLVELLGNPARRQAIGAAARTRVERDFSWPHAIAATLAVYAEVVRPA